MMAVNRNIIKHLYLFDDLSYHVGRLASLQGQHEDVVSSLQRSVYQHLLRAMSCIDASQQDVQFFNWQHACAQLCHQLWKNDVSYDAIVSQGVNGDYALRSLRSTFQTQFSREIAQVFRNVRVAHFLEDSNDAFHSTFRIGVSSGESLEAQCKRVAEEVADLPSRGNAPKRIAIFDDCIQTGEGTRAVTELILREIGSHASVQCSTIGFVACEATLERFRQRGWGIECGVLLRGKTYPESWDWDIYFTKDLLLDNAIRYVNGTSVSYMDGGWFDKIFGGDWKIATAAFQELRAILERSGIYAALESM